MEDLGVWSAQYRIAVRSALAEKRGKPPTTTKGGTLAWDHISMRDECELGKGVGHAIDRESFGHPVSKQDAVIQRGYQAKPPLSFLDLLPA